MIQEDLYTLLSGDAGITALTDRIYPVLGPQNTTYPIVVYQRTSSDRDQNFDEVENFVNSTFQVDSYAETYNASLDLAEAVKAAINGYKGGAIHVIKLDSELDIFEDESELYRIAQRYTIWHTER